MPFLSRARRLSVAPINCLRLFLLASVLFLLAAAPAQAQNPVQLENQKPGTNSWLLTNASANREIEGYASLTSVNRGGQISFFVSTSDANYTMEIYRLGWYNG